MKNYKLNDYDADSPGFLGRERLKLAVYHAGQKYSEAEGGIAEEVDYYDALVQFLAVYVKAPVEELEELSLNDLNKLYSKVIDHITAKEGPDPKASDSTAE